MSKFFGFVGRVTVQLLWLLIVGVVAGGGAYLGGFMHDEVAVMNAVKAERQLVEHKLREAKIQQTADRQFQELVALVKVVNDTIEVAKKSAEQEQAKKAAAEKKALEAKTTSWFWTSHKQ